MNILSSSSYQGLNEGNNGIILKLNDSYAGNQTPKLRFLEENSFKSILNEQESPFNSLIQKNKYLKFDHYN